MVEARRRAPANAREETLGRERVCETEPERAERQKAGVMTAMRREGTKRGGGEAEYGRRRKSAMVGAQRRRGQRTDESSRSEGGCGGLSNVNRTKIRGPSSGMQRSAWTAVGANIGHGAFAGSGERSLSLAERPLINPPRARMSSSVVDTRALQLSS